MNVRAYRMIIKQRGVAAVEFAIIAGLLFSLVFGAFEMGRILFYFNTAGEVTAIGARMAVVCDLADADIKTRMRSLLPILNSNNDIDLNYEPSGCTAINCSSVTVAIAPGVTINTYIPFVPLTVTLPPFRTQLRRESMLSSTVGSPGNPAVNNPVCQ